MTSEIEIYGKDSIKLNFLREVISGTAKLSFQLNGGSSEDYAAKIHKERSRVQVYGKFNISEDPTGEVLTIRPVMIEDTLKVSFQLSASLSGRTISVVRSATKTVEKEYELHGDISFLEFVPQGNQTYIMRLNYADGTDSSAPDMPNSVPRKPPKPYRRRRPEKGEQEGGVSIEAKTRSGELSDNSVGFESFSFDSISGNGIRDDRFASFNIENDAVVPSSQQKQSAVEHLEKIETEYNKDYESLEKDLEDVKARMEADASVIEHYKDHDILPAEKILQEVKLKLEEAETQIRFFIEARQKKTMEIEQEIKSNRKR